MRTGGSKWLAQSEDVEERKIVVTILDINFAILNYKKQAWADLQRLTQDENTNIRIGANHSSGRISILTVIFNYDKFRYLLLNY